MIDFAAERRLIAEMISLLAIRSSSNDEPVSALSGGNQQKVVIAKWLMVTPRIILLNDPTRGIDVGTKQELYGLLRRLAESGVAIVFYSTDYDELINCCNRVLVLFDGSVIRELEGDGITDRALVASASINANDAAKTGERRTGDSDPRAARHIDCDGAVRGHVHHLCDQSSRRLHAQRRHHGIEQGRALASSRWHRRWWWSRLVSICRSA